MVQYVAVWYVEALNQVVDDSDQTFASTPSLTTLKLSVDACSHLWMECFHRWHFHSIFCTHLSLERTFSLSPQVNFTRIRMLYGNWSEHFTAWRILRDYGRTTLPLSWRNLTLTEWKVIRTCMSTKRKDFTSWRVWMTWCSSDIVRTLT